MNDAAWLAELEGLRSVGLYRSLRRVESIQGPVIEVDGQRLLQFSSNNYLDLASHPRLISAAQEAAHYFGTSAAASALVCGHMRVHAELEATLAEFKQAEAALILGSGYLANQSLLTTLVGAGDAIFSDALNHASIIDGCRLSRATVHVYPHGDMAVLERLLQETVCTRRLIVTDGLFSMDGDVAPLDRICRLADSYDATVVVDDAHATGVLGAGGRGTLSHFGLGGDRAITMGTLGKALGSYGAFITAPRAAIELLINRARSFIYSTALPPPSVVAAGIAVQMVTDDPARVDRLHERVAYLRAGLQRLGIPLPADATPIIPLIVGDAEAATALSGALLEDQIWVPAIRPPTVSADASRLRLSVTCGHNEGQLDYLLSSLARRGVADRCAR
ncbi:MAG: 8-amino-7-oxononanoate synthase [Nitrospirota bacterium]|jgi:8-amino-7-oxononanoate synthase